MRPSLVNGVALFATAATLVTLFSACSSADGHTDRGAPAAGPGSSAAVSTPSTAAATDPLAKTADASRILGSPSAKLWVIEVSDFQCPYCKQWHDETYPMLINNYVRTGKVRLAYVNFPLSMHQNARAAATAAMCAGAQGHFWQMHDSLFSSQNRWESLSDPTATFDSLARSTGVEMQAYHSCLQSPAIAALINGDQDRAARAGVNSTPSFWVGSHMIEGAIPASQMRAAIDRALSAPDSSQSPATSAR